MQSDIETNFMVEEVNKNETPYDSEVALDAHVDLVRACKVGCFIALPSQRLK